MNSQKDPESVEIRHNRSIYETSQAKADPEKVVLTVGDDLEITENGNS